MHSDNPQMDLLTTYKGRDDGSNVGCDRHLPARETALGEHYGAGHVAGLLVGQIGLAVRAGVRMGHDRPTLCVILFAMLPYPDPHLWHHAVNAGFIRNCPRGEAFLLVIFEVQGLSSAIVLDHALATSALHVWAHGR